MDHSRHSTVREVAESQFTAGLKNAAVCLHRRHKKADLQGEREVNNFVRTADVNSPPALFDQVQCYTVQGEDVFTSWWKSFAPTFCVPVKLEASGLRSRPEEQEQTQLTPTSAQSRGALSNFWVKCDILDNICRKCWHWHNVSCIINEHIGLRTGKFRGVVSHLQSTFFNHWTLVMLSIICCSLCLSSSASWKRLVRVCLVPITLIYIHTFLLQQDIPLDPLMQRSSRPVGGDAVQITFMTNTNKEQPIWTQWSGALQESSILFGSFHVYGDRVH